MNKPDIPSAPFYFIRHGQTEWSDEHKVMGHLDIPLDAVGLEQAKQVSPSLKNLGIERIVTSPLKRTLTTATIIGEVLHLSPESISGLSEICWGLWQGKTVADGYNFEKWVAGYTPKGAESCQAFQMRIQETVSKILKSPLKTLIVAHNGVYRALKMILQHPRIYPNCEAYNCLPYLFQPQKNSTFRWDILSLKDPGKSAEEHSINGQKWFRVRL